MLKILAAVNAILMISGIGMLAIGGHAGWIAGSFLTPVTALVLIGMNVYDSGLRTQNKDGSQEMVEPGSLTF